MDTLNNQLTLPYFTCYIRCTHYQKNRRNVDEELVCNLSNCCIHFQKYNMILTNKEEYIINYKDIRGISLHKQEVKQ